MYKPSHRVKKLMGPGSTPSDPWPMTHPIFMTHDPWPIDPSIHSLFWFELTDCDLWRKMLSPVVCDDKRSCSRKANSIRIRLFCTGVLVILALLFLTFLFNYIPDASLAAVIISAVYDLIDFSLLAKLWRVNSMYFMRPKFWFWLRRVRLCEISLWSVIILGI